MLSLLLLLPLLSPSTSFSLLPPYLPPTHNANSHTKTLLQAEINMPALSSTMKEGRVVEWLVAEGDDIAAGDAIATIESDKADMEMEAFEDGVMAKIVVQEGEMSDVGAGKVVARVLPPPAASHSHSLTHAPVIALTAASSSEVAAVIAAGVAGDSTSPVPASPASTSPPSPTQPSIPTPTVPFTEVYLPALSSTMTSGKITSWELSVGDAVTAGAAVMVVESDKADMEVEHLGDDG